MSARVRYSDRRSRRRLEPVGIQPGSVDSYLHRLIGYAQRANWGREPVPREDARRG
jgi:hypothetical protein